MKRLTKRDKPQLKNFIEDGVCINESTAVKRLRKFENFIEDHGFEDLQDLERYIEQSVEAGFLLAKKTKENQALKDRWQKLKEWAEKEIEEERQILKNREDEVIAGILICDEALLCKIQELEKGESN